MARAIAISSIKAKSGEELKARFAAVRARKRAALAAE